MPGPGAGLERIPVGKYPAAHHLSGMARGTVAKTSKRRVRDDGWRLPDAFWAEMEPLLPPRPKHPLGCHNPRGPDRAAMDAIFLLRAADGLPVERAARDDDLIVVFGAPALPGMDRGRGVRGVLARGPAGLRRPAGHRLDVAGAGRGDGQGPAGRGEKPAATRRTAASAG